MSQVLQFPTIKVTRFTVSVKWLHELLRLNKPKRFNASNRDITFNDVRVTDFASVNLKNFWEIVKALKTTKVYQVNITVDYTNLYLVITSDDHGFCYNLALAGI